MTNNRIQTLALHTSFHVQENQALCVSVCIKVCSNNICYISILLGSAQVYYFGLSQLVAICCLNWGRSSASASMRHLYASLKQVESDFFLLIDRC